MSFQYQPESETLRRKGGKKIQMEKLGIMNFDEVILELKEIISEDSKLYDQQIEFSNENMQRTQKIRELTKSEEESIEVRLKALGYI